jgi:glucose/mannose-6-phosphate isomerase
MFDLAYGLPEQIEAAIVSSVAALERAELPDHDDIENVVVLGMGGSGIAGDVVREVAGQLMAVPVVVHKGYGCPNFVDEHTLVIAVSFSGNTEETVEAATQAAVDGARMTVVCAGGELGRLADEWGAPHLPVDASIAMPRAAMGAVAVPPLLLLEAVGLFPGARSWLEAAVPQLARRRDRLVLSGNEAEALARRIGRRLPLIYGGGGLGGLAAMRWKTQCNENAKIPAFFNQHPELCHNEICGWGQHGDVTRQVFHLIELRHDFEHPQVMRRFDLTRDLHLEVVGDVDEVRAEGEGPFTQLMDLVLIGDLVSLHLAAQAGVDPGPIPVLVDLKEALSAS